ncbi:MAG: radical SAM protein, partial [Pseudomonadota bacterium]
MVKPAGALCNLDCPYCFYLHKTELLGHEPNARIAADLLEQHIRQYIEAQTGDEVVFSWQGGEPTVMGLAFYEKVVALQALYRKPGQRIENDLQTNGVQLDEAWARFL